MIGWFGGEIIGKNERGEMNLNNKELQEYIRAEGLFDIFQEHGILCLLRRVDLGYWCGYVIFDPKQIQNDKGIPSVEEIAGSITVHWGITFNSEIGGLLVLGFDCGHSGDKTFYPDGSGFNPSDTYRTKEYAKQETKSMAEQIRNMIDRGF